MRIREAASFVKVEPTVEVFREETSTGVLVFHAKVAPPKPRVRRSRAAINRDEATNPEDRAQATKIARARRLLKSLRIIHETRDPALFRTRHRIALLAIAGNLIAIANSRTDRKLVLSDLQEWSEKFIPDATQTELARAYEVAMQDEGFRTIPRPSDIGFDLELDKLHWFKAGRPWGVHPANLSTAEVKKVQRDAKKARDKERAAAKRAASGATPRSMSVLAIARKLGISRPALYKRMREAGFDNATEFYSFVAPINNKKNYIGDESVNPSSRPAASAAPVDDDADLILRRPSATSPNTSKSSPRRAAPRPPRVAAAWPLSE